MNTEEIKTQFVTIIADIIDIYEKTSKLTSKDIDALINNVVTLNKKNMLLKKIYDLEDDIGKLKMNITKANLLLSVEQKEEVEKLGDADPQQILEEKEDKVKKVKVKNIKKEDKIVVVEPVKPAVGIEDKKENKCKVEKKKEELDEKVIVESVKEETAVKPTKKKKEEKVESPKIENEDKKEKKCKVDKKKEELDKKVTEEPVKEEIKEEVKVKPIKKKKEEKVESPKIEDIPIENEEKSETGVDESQQPLHIKRKKIPKQIKTLVWNEYIGNDIMQNKCLCCKKEKIDIRNFHCGHVIAESKGGDLTIKNLRPICAPCNLSMGAMSMNEFTKTFFGWEV
jgi:hypothetical protein